MRIAIETLGTRGDVQPYIALALGLRNSGHEVQLAAPVQFSDMVRERGIACAPLPGEFLELMDTPEGNAAIAGGRGFSAGFKLLKHVRPMMRGLLDTEWAAVRAFAPDVIIYHPKSLASPHKAGNPLHPRVSVARVHTDGGVPESDATVLISRTAEPRQPQPGNSRRLSAVRQVDPRMA